MSITVAVRSDDLTWDELEPIVDGVPDVDYVESYDNAIDPLTLTLIIGGAIAVAKIAIGLWNQWRGGVLIDLNQNPVQIGRSRSIPFGFFVVIAQGGASVEIDGRDEPESALERLLSSILDLAAEPANATADAVRGVVAGLGSGGSARA